MATAQAWARAVGAVGVLALIVAVGASAAALAEGSGPGRAPYPASFVASVSGAGGSSGLAVFSASDGHLMRWLLHSTHGPVPVAISPGGRWVYYFDALTPPPLGRCPKTGFAEPVLWRVRAAGGRPQRTGLRTTEIAFSPDGRMVAYASVRRCGQILLAVVRHRRTGAARTVVLDRNAPTAFAPDFFPLLSWAPDDEHLAVGLSRTPVLSVVYVVNARRATSILGLPPIRPCAGSITVCLDPAFDVYDRLTFLRFTNQVGSREYVVRWRPGRVTRLLALTNDQSAGVTASIATDRSGDAVLIQGGLDAIKIWRWSAGRPVLVLRSSAAQTAFSPLWLR
jgi:hypothetical protein